MSDFQGKFQCLAQGGATAQVGAWGIQWDGQTLTLAPTTGAALAFDLGDLDAFTAAEGEIRLPPCTGRTIVLRQLGKSHETLAHDLTEAYRNRAVECLSLEDRAEVARLSGTFELTGSSVGEPQSGSVEIRLYKSNLAVRPVAARSFQWRLADIDQVTLDSTPS